MSNPDLIPIPFAQNGQKNTIQLDRIVSDPAYRATWAEGFPADTRIPKEVGGEGPDGLDFNGILNALSQAVVFLQKGNAYQFDASLAPYPIGALVRSNDNLTTYQSTIAGNSNNPNSNMTGWRVYNTVDFIKDASTTQKGVVRAATATEVANKSNVNAYVTPSNAALISQSTDFGVGQTYVDVTSSRQLGLTYTNTTPKPILVIIVSRYISIPDFLTIFVNGFQIMSVDKGADGEESDTQFIVPPNATYRATMSQNSNIKSWVELR